MKDTESSNSYAISINKKKYIFSCTDGEEHVHRLQKKVTDTIESVSGPQSGHILSDYAMKLVLLLAHEVVKKEEELENQSKEIESRVTPIVDEIDQILGPKSSFK